MNISLLALAMSVGQPVAPAVPPPALPPSPVLFVKFTPPGTTKVTWYPGLDTATDSKDAGLYPGYPYRLELSEIPGHKNLKLYPSLEVRGTLVPRPGLDIIKHPVPVTLTDRDVEKVRDGKLITKFYYLEDPEKALPVSGTADEPLEFKAENEVEALKEARFRGRPMLILRVGERPFTAAELKTENVAGTILLPGMKTMPTPASPPVYQFAGVNVYDPIFGAKGASEECLHDGGDVKIPAGVGADGKLRGLDPSDTLMQFSTARGLNKVAVSNRVCICVPRFAASVAEIGFASHHAARTPIAGVQVHPVTGLHNKTAPSEQRGADLITGMVGSTRPGGVQSVTAPGIIEQLVGKPQGVFSTKGVAAVATLIGVDEITAFPNCNSLLLQKRVDPPNPDRIGQEVTFYIRFTNATKETINSVIVADSLTARLEYLENTAKCSRPATFTIQKNEAGSVILKWAIDDKMQPGEDGIISFKAKIR